MSDFELGVDRVHVVTYPGGTTVDFAYVQAHTTQVGADAVIEVGGSAIVLLGVQASLSAASLMFTTLPPSAF